MEFIFLAKFERKAAGNSTFLHSNISKINMVKSQGNESVLIAQPKEKCLCSMTKNIPNR